jgi:hypothetical protein
VGDDDDDDDDDDADDEEEEDVANADDTAAAAAAVGDDGIVTASSPLSSCRAMAASRFSLHLSLSGRKKSESRAEVVLRPAVNMKGRRKGKRSQKPEPRKGGYLSAGQTETGQGGVGKEGSERARGKRGSDKSAGEARTPPIEADSREHIQDRESERKERNKGWREGVTSRLGRPGRHQ